MTATEIRPVGTVGDGGARVAKHYRGVITLDNYDPPRREDVVMIEEWDWSARGDGFTGLEFVIMGGLDLIHRPHHARVLLDDGQTLRLMYVSGWHPEHRYVGLKTMTPNTVGPADGPAVLYHIKITEAA